MRFVTRHLIKFLIIGALTFVIDVGLYTILTRSSATLHASYEIVSVVTALLAILFGYLLNSYWTFERTIDRYGLMRYYLVYGVGIIFQSMLFVPAVQWGHWNDIEAKIVAIIIVSVLWNFTLAKYWVFRYALIEA